MRVFDDINSKNIDEFAEWLEENGVQDFSPWDNWFDKEYCKKCEPIVKENPEGCYYKTSEYSWCELNGRCKYFQDMNEIPYGKRVVKMWLESEVLHDI